MAKMPPAPPSAPPSPPPPSQAKAAPARERKKLAFSKPEKSFVPPRIVLQAVEGWGKTSVAAYADNPAIIMVGGETGYLTLHGAGLAPSINQMHVDAWQDLLDVLDTLAQECPIKTLAIDAMGGAERMCHEHVCNRDFKGDWSERGFASFQKGYDQSVNEWIVFLHKLDAIHRQGVTILLLSHSQVKGFRNPLGDDFDRYISDVHNKTWMPTARWADAVLFGNFYTEAKKERGQAKAKGIGDNQRMLFCERRDAFDAKNRYGMQDSLLIPNDPSQMWGKIWEQIQK